MKYLRNNVHKGMNAGMNEVKLADVSAVVQVFKVEDKFKESDVSCNQVILGLFVMMNDTCSIDKFTEVLVKVVRKDSIEVSGAKPVDVHQVLHCLITT